MLRSRDAEIIEVVTVDGMEVFRSDGAAMHTNTFITLWRNSPPARSAWTYFKRLWSFGLLERRSRGRGTLEYGISDQGLDRLRWLRSRRD